jgi:hypothetical protein
LIVTFVPVLTDVAAGMPWRRTLPFFDLAAFFGDPLVVSST